MMNSIKTIIILACSIFVISPMAESYDNEVVHQAINENAAKQATNLSTTLSALGVSNGLDAVVSAAVHALTAGHPGHVRALAAAMAAMGGGGDPLSALAQLLAPGGLLSGACRFCYELRLHRARGYGALKAILDVLAQEEPLTLSAVAQRMAWTPGSTKDYLSWLEDVDLVQAARKRYRITDPLLRLWIRLYGRPCPPTDDDLAREIHRYASERLPLAPAPEAAEVPPVPPLEPTPVSVPERDRPAADRSWGIIEID